ncbi:MAG: portal protein [Euryarchaeota archaeon TMED129]|nr:MAG: portal protein [Euryarchaeota archaeon TMED129]|tara:strand:+ start:1795 stop:3438 length:1644 start_codon:yes stop_codon:yes gene_type:complete
MSQLFGYSLDRKKSKGSAKGPSFVHKDNDDAAQPIAAGGHFGQYVDLGDSANKSSDVDLIGRYRAMSLHPEADAAINDIVNEAIAGDLDDHPVDIELSNLKVSDAIKTRIREEFDNVLSLLDFDRKAYDIFRRWYIDGRLFYHKMINPDNPKEGITELRYIDPRKIKKVIEYDKPKDRISPADPQVNVLIPKAVEYYIYAPKGLRGYENNGIKIAPDAVAFAHSGQLDMQRNCVLSHLHKAIKALNQLRMIEDSLVIYRLSRAPERRIFYIDVGNLPKQKAEQYLREVMSRYRNKLVYNADTGEIRDDKKFMSMLEDFWLPRREGGRGTEITTLPGGQNLGELEDVKYFQKKLYRSLNVPESRLESDSSFNVGRSAEITRDEVKFQKFVVRLRKKFGDLFNDLLKTQLILKGVFTPEEWEDVKEHIQYDFVADNYFAELKEQEIMNARMALLEQMDPYVGKYFSLEYMRRQILKQPDALFKDIDKDMAQEIKDGKVIDPMQMQQMEVEQMAMSLQPPEPEPVDPQQQAMDQYAQQGIDPADRKKGDF